MWKFGIWNYTSGDFLLCLFVYFLFGFFVFVCCCFVVVSSDWQQNSHWLLRKSQRVKSGSKCATNRKYGEVLMTCSINLTCEHWNKIWRSGGSDDVIKISLCLRKNYTNTEQTKTVTVDSMIKLKWQNSITMLTFKTLFSVLSCLPPKPIQSFHASKMESCDHGLSYFLHYCTASQHNRVLFLTCKA